MPNYEDFIPAGEHPGADFFNESEFAARVDSEDLHYWHVHRREFLLSELRAYPPAGQTKLLELGCGVGTVATYLNQHGLHVDYSDIFGLALELTKRRAERVIGDAARRRRYLRIDITRPLPSLEHGGLLAFDVVEHLPDDARVMRQMADSLRDKPNGFVVLTVPAFQFLWSPWDDLEKHKRRYTKQSLTALLEGAGFRVERTTCFFSPLFFAALGVKGLRRARDAVSPAGPAETMTDLTESANHPLLNGVMRRVLALEKPLLRRGTLAFGTSLLAIARLER